MSRCFFRLLITSLVVSSLSFACGRTGLSGHEVVIEETPDARSAPPDGGEPECRHFQDCAVPGEGQGCSGLSGCGCGFFFTCQSERCVYYTVDCSDGGPPPRGDAGLQPDAGPPSCVTSRDCGGADRIADPCLGVGRSGTSCIDGECLAECRPDPRTCHLTPSCPECGDCLECDDGSSSCTNFCAAAGVEFQFEVEQSNCGVWPFSGQEVMGSVLHASDLPGPTCSYSLVQLWSGLELGRYHLLDNFEYLAQFSELGGTCTGVSLPTGLERIHFSCPRCFIQLVRR